MVWRIYRALFVNHQLDLIAEHLFKLCQDAAGMKEAHLADALSPLVTYQLETSDELRVAGPAPRIGMPS